MSAIRRRCNVGAISGNKRKINGPGAIRTRGLPLQICVSFLTLLDYTFTMRPCLVTQAFRR